MNNKIDNEIDNEINNEIVNEPKSRAYIREWKRKDYQKNSDTIRAKNKAYYYKKKFGLTCDDMKNYDILLPEVGIIMENLNKIKKSKPDLINIILKNYLV